MGRRPSPYARNASILFVAFLCGALSATSSQATEETFLRNLVADFFFELQHTPSQKASSYLSRQSPDFTEIQDLVERDLSYRDGLEVHIQKIGEVNIRDSRATVFVALEITPVAPTAFSMNLSSLYAERLVHCVKEDGLWKIWRLGPTTHELAIKLASESSPEERRQLLNADKELATPLLVQVIISIADRFFQQGNYQAARTVYVVADEIASAIADKSGEVSARRGTGNILFYAHQNAQALAVYRAALKIAEEVNNKVEIVRTLDAIGNVYSASPNAERALLFFRRSLELATELGDDHEKGRIFNNIGNVQFAGAQYPAALRSYRHSLAIKLRSGNDAAISIALYNIANTLYAEGRYSEALKHYEDSLQRCEKAGRKAGLASIHRGMGDAYYSILNDGRAAQNYTRSVDFSRELGDITAVFESLAKLGLIYYSRAEYQRALETDQEALGQAERTGDRAQVALILDRIALVQQAMGKTEKAIENFQTSAAIREDLPDHRGLARTFASLGATYKHKREYKKALMYFDLGLKRAREDHNWLGVMQVLTLLSDLRYEGTNYRDSIRLATRAGVLACRFNVSEVAWRAEALAARAYLALGLFTFAKRHAAKAIRIYEEMEANVRDGESELTPYPEGLLSPYEVAIQVSFKKGDKAGAWFYCERAKAIKRRNALRTGDRQFTESLVFADRRNEQKLADDVQAARTELWNALRSGRSEGPSFKEIIRRYRQARNTYTAFEARIVSSHPGLRCLRGETPPQKWEQARSSLPGPDEAFVEFSVLSDSVLIFVLRRCQSEGLGQIACPDLNMYMLKIGEAELSTLVERYRSALQDSGGTYLQPAEELYRLLMRPIAAQLRAVRMLYVVPDGLLWCVSFAALAETNGRFLIEHFSISYFPSFAAYRQNVCLPEHIARSTTDAAQLSNSVEGERDVDASLVNFSALPPSLMVLADPVVSSRVRGEWDLLLRGRGIQRSAGRIEEINNIMPLFSSNRSVILLGQDASKSALQKHARQSDLIHIAAPVILDDHDPTRSIVLLAPSDEEDAALETHEIDDLKARARVVVLSASQMTSTETHSSTDGQSIIAIRWAWLGGSCSQLVLSMWISDAFSAGVLWSRFYPSLVRGGPGNSSTAEALRKAQLSMIAEGPFGHPFYWAGFMVMGCK